MVFVLEIFNLNQSLKLLTTRGRYKDVVVTTRKVPNHAIDKLLSLTIHQSGKLSLSPSTRSHNQITLESFLINEHRKATVIVNAPWEV